jgi:hypothetical protein
MAMCGAMLVVGLVFGVRWSTLPFEAPPPIEAPSWDEVARRYVWWCSLLLAGGITAGVTVMGAGGRLAMRLLAVTSPAEAQGRITEADEIVGEITVDGTIGFIVFNGIVGGVLAGAIYLITRRFLPPRWRGGLAFGAGLLIVLGTTIDPLRDENPDFDIVGPDWLSVLVFTAMALAFGVVLAGFMARLSTWLPLPSTARATLVRYLPVAAVAAFGFSVTIALALLGVFVVIATRWTRLLDAVRSPTAIRVGQVALLALVGVSLPGAIQSIANILNG